MAENQKTYLLNDCDNQPQYIHTGDLSQYVGSIISLSGIIGCFTIGDNSSLLSSGCETIEVTYKLQNESPVTITVNRAGEANGKNAYSYSINNNTWYLSWYEEEDGFKWRTNKIGFPYQATFSDDSTCPFGNFSIEDGSIFESFIVSPVVPTISNPIDFCYNNCQECNTTAFFLESCDGYNKNIYASDPNLSLLNDKVVKIPYYNNGCFKVTRIPYDKSLLHIPIIEVSYSYDTCIGCYNQEVQEAILMTSPICNPEVVEEISCTFSDMMYQQMMSRKLGIKFCCPIEKDKSKIKFSILENQLMNDVYPSLPEPYVDPCCIPVINTCQTTPTCQPCGATTTPVNCEPITPTCLPCNCLASIDSPHDCHTYIVNTTPESVALASGNDEEYFNGKVFFAYFKCKDTTPTFQIFTQELEEDLTLCVLGIPAFGYYKDNIWLDLPITRGNICEPVQTTNTCCNDCT